jgi:hypothetical protein
MLGMKTPVTPGHYNYPFMGMGNRYSYQSGTPTKVVHDTLNNKYYGTQRQADLVKGLEDSIKRTQGQLGRKSETSYSTGWMGSLNTSTRYYTAKDRKEQNARLKQQQQYLKNIQGGMYKQEANTFFDSYNDHTQGWNNVFTKRYNNEQQRIRNERTAAQNVITKAKNEKIKARNKVIGKANVRNQKIKDMNAQMENNQLNQQATANTLSYNVGPSTKLEINTGLASEKTQNRKKANAVLADNGLNI